MNDVLGQAIWDYHNNIPTGKLWIHNKYGPKEEMYIKTYFRDVDEMPDLELIALQNCTGKVLDIGAGAGSHSLLLQEKEIDVTALEISPKASEVIKLRGIQKVLQEDIFSFTGQKFDTLLLLMNGIGLTGNLQNLAKFFTHAKSLINDGGQLIFDSSDVAYLYDGKPNVTDRYYGEIEYSYEYKKQRSEWFTWLYIDIDTLTKIAKEQGWQTEVLTVDEFDHYLVRLTLEKT